MSNAITPVAEFKHSLSRARDGLAKLLGKNVDPEKFERVAMTTIQANPGLLEKDRHSLFHALHKCAEDGLMPDGREAALVPFGGKVSYMPMVAGYLKRARNSGEITTIDAQVVYEKDEYDEWTDEKGPHFKFRRARGDRGARIGVFAYAVTMTGGTYFEFIDAKTVEGIASKSRSKEIWNGPFADEMWRKTALRRLCKHRLPSSSDMTSMLKSDEAFTEEATHSEPAEEPKTSSRLQDIITDEPPNKPQGDDLPI